jgi:hypothetical protein
MADPFHSATPLYRQRMAARRQEESPFDEDLKLAQLFHHVFGTPAGIKVLDHICNVLCKIDEPFLAADPMLMADANARRNVGVRIAILALAPYDASKPEVKV